jgi:putative hemolysin
MSAADGGVAAANLYRQLSATAMADETLRVWPRHRLEVERFDHIEGVQAPALIKGYLRAGAKLLGEPHCDPEFGCVDFPMMLDLAQLTSRYRQRFLAAP